ncbi:MAG: heavy metal-binding domain-containing protein [Deltaproteobacteria bacterium]|nr:heavy metal-binding domain-containing protein [Deltaproteobacteria bacterium]
MDLMWLQVLVPLGVVGLLLLLGAVVGGSRERAHLADLDRRERAVAHMLVTGLRRVPGTAAAAPTPKLLTGEAAIGADYLKTFVAGLRKLVGGEVRSYRKMLARARREATLRVVEAAAREGYDAVYALRLESSDIGGNALSGQGMPMAVILAYGTACRRAGPAQVPPQA